ncbi:MAG: nuclear transport factor 2 family protein [Pseudomonadota bacterium]
MIRKIIAAPALAILATSAAPIAAQDATTQPLSAATSEQDEVKAKAQAVQRHIDAYRSRDLDRFVATFAPNAQVYANGMVATGHKQIREFYRLNFAPGAPKISIRESGMAGPYVYVTIGYVTKDGNEVCCSYSEYEVIEGKITYLSASG